MRKGHFLCIMVIALLASLAGVCDGPGTAETCPQDCVEAPAYEVVSITTLTTDGGRLDWSHDGLWIYYDHLEPDGFWDVYRIHPDGTGNECITCDRPELPNNNQGQPQMHPNGRYLVFQAEKAEHAGTVGGPATGPGGGYYNDLWVLDLEAGIFHQLTDVRSGFLAGGSLHSHFSNDGTKLLWSDLERFGGRFGDWQLAVADFVTFPSPHLENHQYYNPGPQPIWLEAHGWGPDDSWIYFTCTPVAGMDDNNQDICRMDFSNPTEVTRLTFTSGLSEEPGEWDEHAHLSPLHDAFSWISSTPYGTESTGPYGQWLQTEVWLMNVDGSNHRRMTFFNDTEDTIVADNDWNPSAALRAGPAATGNQQLAATMFMRDRNETHIKIIEFSHAGPPCALVGDLDCDCDVDIADIMLVAGCWHAVEGAEDYDPAYDLDSNGVIDIVDIMLVAVHWGESCMGATEATTTVRATIVVDAAEVTGTIRSLQGINAGPRGKDRQSHLFRQYEDIGVDYVRTHDYYGPADMHVLFPNLQADPNDESSYDFTSTDRELEAIKRVGAKILFRLGYSWGDPHAPVTYVAPQDREAWAQAAVHVAKHYNDGWADGFHWDIEYWEVWNESDITPFWTGTPEEYYQLYEVVARALKSYDPTLKVGGPGLCCQNDFLKGFLAYCRDHDVPLDFVSWHIYDGGASPYVVAQRAEQVQLGLDTYGFTDAENLLTEWNVSVWGNYEHLRDATGAAWTVSALTYLQDTTVAIANRYRADGGLGMFTSEGFYTKPAYGFLAFRWMLETPQRLSASGSNTAGYTVLAGRASGETSEVSETSEVWSPMVQILISDYDSNHTGFDLTVNNLPWGAGQPYHYERYLLDETHDLTLVESADVPADSDSFTTSEAMAAPGVQLIRLFVPAGETMPQITIHADQTLDPISPLLYGLNHRYLNSGYGVWDTEAQQVHPEVIGRSLEIGFPVTRFPGGTVGSTYHWTDGIGLERPTGISGFDGAPATNEYGFDEQMLFMEQVGATTNVVVNFGTGTAQEAAAWVAYANGNPADTRPIGVDELGVNWGTVGEWAAQRETNQIRLGMTSHPYNIAYWEVGNELYGDWEYSWTHSAIKYAAGGTAWQYNQRVVKEDDWRDSVSRSNGQPSQVFYLRYPPVVTGTQTITVANTAWTEVPDLSVAGPDAPVYEFDPRQGEIRFGDDVHGRIPPAGALILSSYESGPHDGFVDYYAAMKAVDPDIQVGSCMYSDAFLQAMGKEYPYDFLTVHPYYSSGVFGRGGPSATLRTGLAEAHLRTMAGPLIRQMDLEDLQAGVRLYAGEQANRVQIAITEHNLYVRERESPTPHYGMSLDQGLFVADMLRTMIELGVPLGDLHCLISLGEGEGWDNTPVLSPYPELILRPAAYVLQLFNQHFAPVRVESEVEDTPLLTGSLPALEVVASTDETGGRLTLLVINKEASMPITATVAVSGFIPASEATAWTLNGPDIAAFNDQGHPTDVTVTESSIADASERFAYAFPAHSVTLIELVAASSHSTPTPTATPSPTPTSTPTSTATPTSTPTPTLTATSRSRLYLPLILKDYTPTTPTPTPTPTSTPMPSAGGIVLADRPSGLELVSAPVTIPITVGHVAYLPVEVQNYHRPITVTVQTLIHTYVNDATPAEPGDSSLFAVGTLQRTQNELKLQTLRMRPHAVTLTFTVPETRFLEENGFLEQDGDMVSTTLTIQPTLQPRAPLFGAGFIPDCPECYWGGLSEPYDLVHGPDCTPCPTYPGDPPGTSRDVRCIKTNHLSPCDCRPIAKAFNAEEDILRRTTDALVIQRYASQILRHQIGWTSLQPYPATPQNPEPYLLEGLDWLFHGLSPQERDYSPLLNDFMEGIGGWMSCPDDYPMIVNTGSGSSIGFYDENNAALVEQYRLYVRELATRYGPELRFLETVNEPCYGFYLCPCRDNPPCEKTWPRGPDHQVCDDLPQGFLQPHQTQEFADVYAEFLYHSADIAAEELQNAGSDALLVAGALELSGAGLTETTEKMIRLGLLERDNVAFMIHQFPYPGAPNWIEHEECTYGPGWYLPPGCETAPPLQDYTTPGGRPVAARDMWRQVDEAIDVSEILSDVVTLGEEMAQPDASTGSAQPLLDRFYLFDTELHGGFGIKDQTTNAGRTAIAGLRIGAINSHQRFAGLLFIGNNSDPTPYNVMVKHLAGVTPVYRWAAPLMASDYSGLVYKLFTRPVGQVPVTSEVPGTSIGEDIIAIWSNAETPMTLNLTLAAGSTQFKEVTLTRIFGPECPTVDCRGLTEEERVRVDVGTERLSTPPASISILPLQEFYFLSVISDRPGFGWLADLTTAPSYQRCLALPKCQAPVVPVLENAYLRLAFDPANGALAKVHNRQRDLSLITQGDTLAPFRVGLDDPTQADPEKEIVLSNFHAFTWTIAADQTFVLTWELAYSLTLTATVTLPADSPDAAFSWSLANPQAMTVNWVAYPYLEGIGPLGQPSADDRAATLGPISFLREDPWQHLPAIAEQSRLAGWSGSNLLLYYRQGSGGFYAAIQDDQGGSLHLFRRQVGGPLALAYLHRWKTSGGAILGVLQRGDWYEGADRYRAWAEQQPWVGRGTLRQRVQTGDAARWLVEGVGFATFGIASSFDQAAWYDALHDITAAPVFHVLGVDWPRGPLRYGNESTWFPARFHTNNLSTIRANGDRFAPFEFDFFFNRFAAGWQTAQPWAAKDWQGEVQFWEEEEINALMCPATAYWRDFHAWRDATLARDYGADANYYDISFPVFCWDTDHEHPPGPGPWLREAQRQVYTTTHAATLAASGYSIPQGKEVLEDERLLDTLDFYQARAWAGPVAAWEYGGECEIVGGCQVIPLMEYIYHEYGPLRLDGWGKLAYDFGDIFYWIAGRVALWGGLFELNYEFSPLEAFSGMENRSVCHVTYGYTLNCYPPGDPEWRQVDPAKVRFLQEIAAARTGFARDYLAYGRMMRPPQVTGTISLVGLDWFRYNDPAPERDNVRGVYTTTALLQAAYNDRSEKAGFLFVSLLPAQTLPITVTVNPADYGLNPASRYLARRATYQENENLGHFQGTATFTLSLPSRQVVLLEVMPAENLYLPLILKCAVAGTATPTPTPTASTPASPTATASPTRTVTVTPTASPTPMPTASVTPSPTNTPPPTVTPTSSPVGIILADRAGGLELVSAPIALSLAVGHATYLPVEVQDYHRPITVSAQTLIHTYVNDVTPGEPGDSPPFDVGTLDGPQNELQLQTLRLRPHSLALSFSVGQDGDVVSTTFTLEPVVQLRSPLFGVHSTPFYDGLPAPFIRVWGPDCGSCPTTPGDPPGSTRDIGCAKALNDTCRCHPFQEVFDSEADDRVRGRAPEQQRYASHFVRSIGGWGGIQHQPGQYLWQGLDWLFDDLSPQERDYSPLFSGIMDGNFGWMTCPEYTNPDGSVGFFDLDNTYLVEQYRAHVRATTERYNPDLRFVEMSNEPAAEFYLCPCIAPGGTCNATSGPNQPTCLLGPNSPEFVATYGDLLFTAADIAAEELATTNADGLVITGALDMPPNNFGLSLTTAYMITRSLLTHDNVAIGIHQYPYLNPPNWISPTLNCAYYQMPGNPYWLPPGCETAPPFEDYVTPAGRPIPARYTWRQFDERVDVSNLLHSAEALGVLDRIYFFDTELHAGWHDSDPTTTPAREAMAGLRIGSINTHQRVLGSEFIFAPTDPTAYNLLVKHLAGATPVYAWDAPLMDADYSGLVYKLFTRPVGQGTSIGEDIIALWSNAEEYQQLTLSLAAEPTQFKQVTLTSFEAVLPRADEPERLSIFTENKTAPPESILVRPIKQFYFLSVISDRPGFGWLADLRGEGGSMGDILAE